MSRRPFFVVIFLFMSFCATNAQTTQNDALINKLGTAVADAKAKVALNEKKIAAADSLIDAGKKMIDESKDEIKAIDAESKKYEKDYAPRYKAIKKLTGSKDKAEARKASNELRTLEAEHRTANRGFEAKMNNAYKKQNLGLAAIDKGQKAKYFAKTALDTAEDALKTAQEKYDAATTPAEEKGKGKSK